MMFLLKMVIFIFYDICILIFAYFGLIFKKLTKRNKMGCLIDI